eukprot:UN00495
MCLRQPNTKATVQLHITTNFPTEKFPFDINDTKYKHNKSMSFRHPSPSVTKSCMQKNVRRGRAPRP